MIRTRLTRLAPALLLIPLAACPQVGHLWLAEGSTAANLVVIAGYSPGKEGRVFVNFMWFERCADTGLNPPRLWSTGFQLNGETHVSRIRYGVPPGGWEQSGPAPVLGAGCYRAGIGASPGSVSFQIDSLGQVRTLPESGSRSQ